MFKTPVTAFQSKIRVYKACGEVPTHHKGKCCHGPFAKFIDDPMSQPKPGLAGMA